LFQAVRHDDDFEYSDDNRTHNSPRLNQLSSDDDNPGYNNQHSPYHFDDHHADHHPTAHNDHQTAADHQHPSDYNRSSDKYRYRQWLYF
jgi:hypothetical protein